MTRTNLSAAIVTGVSRGLGEALAVELLGRGLDVLGVGRSSSVKLKGERYRFAECDMSKPALIAAALTPELRALADAEPASVVLLNNAAVAAPAGVLGALDAAGVEVAIATNLTGPMVLIDLFCRAFHQAACARRVINISSGAAQTPVPGASAYAVSKAGLEMLTRALAVDHPAASVLSIGVRPGIFDSQMQAWMRGRNPAEFPSAQLFRRFKSDGLLKAPAEVAARLVERFVFGPIEHGRIYSHTDM